MKDTIKVGFNIGLGELLTIVFIVLKLTTVINWSWLWVLSPIWISFTIGIIILIIGLLISLKD